VRNSHCGWCGAPFETDTWPRPCSGCGNTSYRNPLPVAVLVVPVDDGVLTIRRGVAPKIGELALPGGYIDFGEDWRAACVRELREETGIELDPATVTLRTVCSAPDGTLLVFGIVPPRRSTDLPPFRLSDETQEVVVVRERTDLAFSLHTRVLDDWLGERGGS
jgi:ADP-ribose pyrophosphatase YjhB (NUDIX family)